MLRPWSQQARQLTLREVVSGYSSGFGWVPRWPLHDIVITNIVWCVAYRVNPYSSGFGWFRHPTWAIRAAKQQSLIQILFGPFYESL